MRVGATLTQVGAIVLAMAGAIAPIARVGAQTTEATAFDVASVKENASGDFDRMELGIRPGGRFTARNVTLLPLIQLAYGVKLRPARAPVDVLVVDRIEHPTPD
jgi:hypothetical protein